MSAWDEAAATLEGARAAAWAEPAHRYEERAAECAELVVALVGDVERAGRRPIVVDLGCGPGRLLVAVRRVRPGWALVGVDSSRAMVRWAHVESRLVDPDGAPIVTMTGDVTDLPGGWAAEFDAAWSVAVLQHLDPALQERAVGEVGRVLRRGGRAVLQVVEGGSHDGPLSHDTDAADLRRWAAGAGMAVVGEARGLVQPGWLWATLERR